jgi:hypothetical protein
MARTFAKLAASLLVLSSLLFSQGLTTTATKDDWEEINFEFNSAILSDGYPSLLRVAELLNKNPDYKVRLTGNTDWVGSHPFNDKLGRNRANAVRQFLEKYGARPNQISIDTKGEASPKVDNKTREGRFMNRRVEMAVTDGTGKVIGAGGVGDTIKAMEALAKKQEECCSQILRRLDKLDEILAAIRDLKNQNEKLRADVEELKRGGGTRAAAAPAPAPGPSPEQMQRMADDAATRAVADLKKSGGLPGPKFSILGMNVGPDSNGDVTFSGRGRFFNPFNRNLAFQAQGEYMYFRDRNEGQFDIGLVNRWWNIQLGGFASFKTVGMKEYSSNATLGQWAGTFDYLFKQGKIGLFGTKAFMREDVIGSRMIGRNILEESFLRTTDQFGGQGALSLGKHAWVEGNVGYVKTLLAGNKPGGTIRLVFPLNRMVALTAEGGFNETLITRDHNGRAVFGFMFGNYLTPREYVAADHPVPVEIPRVRYELLTRRTRTGNDPPVADAGPDQTGARAGTIQLDGSGSFDPDGDPITFLWTQIAGPSVALSSPAAARTSFMAAEGQVYSFRLTVRDDKGAQGIARVSISTREAPRVRIIRFTANSPLVRPNEPATLNYVVENADQVSISGISEALRPDTGSVSVRPAMTTSYTLTARNRVSEDTAVVTVIVERPLPRIIRFTAVPATILQGGRSVLQWQTQDADSVEIPNVGSYAPNGSVEVAPGQTQVYTLIARNRNGEATASTVVTVESGPKPTISFAANPVQIVEGDSSTLSWTVQNADDITIQPFGTVSATGSRQVTPAQTTTYTITATNRFGSSSAAATVEVIPRARIVSCTVNPTTINKPGQPVTFSWQTENALYVFIDGGIGQRAASGSLTNAGPIRSQTYTLTAVGRGSQASCTFDVALVIIDDNTNRPPTAVIAGSGEIVTSFRELQLNGGGSFDPDGDTLTYSWRSTDGRAIVLDPSSPRTTVRLIQTNYGDFNFELTVTDKAGLTAKSTTRVILVQARPIF